MMHRRFTCTLMVPAVAGIMCAVQLINARSPVITSEIAVQIVSVSRFFYVRSDLIVQGYPRNLTSAVPAGTAEQRNEDHVTSARNCSAAAGDVRCKGLYVTNWTSRDLALFGSF